MPTRLRFCTEDDMLRYEPSLDKVRPRTDKDGNPRWDWDVQLQLAHDEIERRLRASKSTTEPFELGRLGLRSRERLRDVAACFALHFIFVAADSQGDQTGYYADKRRYYLRRAEEMLTQESMWLDYDADNSGDLSLGEKNEPFVARFIRG